MKFVPGGRYFVRADQETDRRRPPPHGDHPQLHDRRQQRRLEDRHGKEIRVCNLNLMKNYKIVSPQIN